MLYLFKFTIHTPPGQVQQENFITAGSAANADYIYKANIYNHLHDEEKFVNLVGFSRRLKDVTIECIAEVGSDNSTPKLSKERLLYLVEEIRSQLKTN